jgi:hypothetical protein
MNDKRWENGLLVCLLLAFVATFAACGDDSSNNDVTDTPAEDVAADADADGDGDGTDTPLPDAEDEGTGDVPVEDAADVPEDAPAEEGTTVECPVATAGTASIGGTLHRGTDMPVVSSDTDLDAVGDMVVAVFDEDPILATTTPTPVATARITAADLSLETNSVEFCVQNIPPGDFWLGASLDDDGSGVAAVASLGDIVTMPIPTGTLAADEAIEDAAYVLNVRVGRVSGSVTIDPTFAATMTDLTGDLYVAVVDSPTVGATLMGFQMYPGVTLSADGAQPYEVLLRMPAPTSGLGYVVAIHDIDESGVVGFPSIGDLVNFVLGTSEPPSFTYDTTGLDATLNTQIIAQFSF